MGIVELQSQSGLSATGFGNLGQGGSVAPAFDGEGFTASMQSAATDNFGNMAASSVNPSMGVLRTALATEPPSAPGGTQAGDATAGTQA